MIVLGIESSCDETSISIVEDGCNILSLITASQIDTHQEFGGVFPEIASRKHLDIIFPLIEKALSVAKKSLTDIDLIAATQGPGLVGSLLVGLHAAKSLSYALDIPFVGVNHLEAHLYASMMEEQTQIFPAIGVVISGGHTFLVHIKHLRDYELISTTVDDAIGEAFDKVARMLDLPYPGGPEIEKMAQGGDPSRYPFKGGFVKGKPLHFSFSGLKTSVLYACEKEKPLSLDVKKNIAASFQRAAISDIVEKTKKALMLIDGKAIYLGGGVCKNKFLQTELRKNIESDIPLFFPKGELCLDNGAMIAGLGYHIFLEKSKGDSLEMQPFPRKPLSKDLFL